jgi:hypothetical protein
MPNHATNCDCLHCQLAKGYIEMASINLSEARTYEQIENEALELALSGGDSWM